MTALVILFVGMTVAVIAFVLQPRLGARRLVFADQPDVPKAFGYRMSWLALKTADATAVLDALQIAEAKPANWNCGIGTVYDEELSDKYLYVTPPVGGWIFVVGVALPHPVGRSFVDKMGPLLATLAARFSEVQYYAAFPFIDYFGWVRLSKGRLLRAFVIGDNGVIWDRGRLTADERALGLKLFDLRGIKGRKGDAGGEIMLYPTEQQVLGIASAWSRNPLQIDQGKVEEATGFIVEAPTAWRAERVKKAA